MLGNVPMLEPFIEPMAPDLTDEGTDHGRKPASRSCGTGKCVRWRQNELGDSCVYTDNPRHKHYDKHHCVEEYLGLQLKGRDIFA